MAMAASTQQMQTKHHAPPTVQDVHANEEAEEISKDTPPSMEQANWLSRLTFWYLNPLLSTGFRRALQFADAAPLPHTERAQAIGQRFQSIIQRLYGPYLPGSRRRKEEREQKERTNGQHAVTIQASESFEPAKPVAVQPSADTSSSSPSPSSTLSSSPPSLFRAIWSLIGPAYLYALFFQFISETLAFAGPILVQLLTQFLDDPEEPTWHGWLYTALLFVLPTIASVARSQHYVKSWQVGIRIRAAILTALFNKSLRLSPAARRLATDGQILTLVSTDAQKLAEICPLLFVIFTAPLSLAAAFILLWLQVRAATLAGLAVILLLMPTNIYLGRKSGGYRREEARETDKRMRFVKESVSNMKTIKSYGWSRSFLDRIREVRRKEIKIRTKAAYLEAMSNSILILQPVLISLVTFLTFAGMGEQLTATNVFTSLALFNVMRFQLSQFPLVLTALFEARVCMARIRRVLLREEIDPAASRDYSEELPMDPEESVIEIRGASFSWDLEEEAAAAAAGMDAAKDAKTKNKHQEHGKQASNGTATANKNGGSSHLTQSNDDNGHASTNFKLHAINIRIRRGKLVACVGAVGQGKSSLLAAILGEIGHIPSSTSPIPPSPASSSSSKAPSSSASHMMDNIPPVKVRGRMGLAAQTAWILNASLRENILFGLPFDEVKYNQTIEACCLKMDLEQLPEGDATPIGDRGVNLSGGQKQRAAIARLVYSVLFGKIDTICMDDPLSAVDAHVSKALVHNLLRPRNEAANDPGGLFIQHGCTVIIALNQLPFLPWFDEVIVMSGGRVVQQGTFRQLMDESEGELAALMNNYGFQEKEKEKDKEKQDKTDVDTVAATSLTGVNDNRLDGMLPQPQPQPDLSHASATSNQSSQPAGSLINGPQPQPIHSTSETLSPPIGAARTQLSSTVPSSAAPAPLAATALAAASTAEPNGTHALAAPANGTVATDDGASKPTAKTASSSLTAASTSAPATSNKAESRVEGKVSWNVYKAYMLSSGGWWVLLTLIFLFCIHQSGRVSADFWLAFWSGQDWAHPAHPLGYWMGIFAIFGAVVTLASLIRSTLFANRTCHASLSMHNSMLDGVFLSPTSFFDTTPVGRIVNRFASDIDKMDHLLCRTLEGWAGCIFFVLGTFIAICTVYVYFFAPLLVIIAIYWKIQQYYIASSRELQRLDSISRSPILSHIGESLNGVASIRAFDRMEEFERKNEDHVDSNHRQLLTYQMCLCWLAVRVELISTLLMTISSIFAVSNRHSSQAGLVGLSIVYAITITSFLNFSVRLGSILEGLFSSVERVDELTHLEPEAPLFIPSRDPNPSWPEVGRISFEDAWMKYRPELDYVLKGISCQIEGGEKVGIIGRTGSGKSSLLVSLFRLVELNRGHIRVDGIDISSIGLEVLRQRLTLIPQDPTIFSASIRYNLDPFHRYSEEDIWAVLKLVNLESKVASMDGGLEFVLSEGESLSVGERQLLCVARALLRKTNILILDEATASVDVESDNLIQHVIASHFSSCTILAIAHRLSSIIHYDRIIVMDGGRIVEFDAPYTLLQREDSALKALVDATGTASAQHLYSVAKEAWELKQTGQAYRLVQLRSRRSAEDEGESKTHDVDPNIPEPSVVRFHHDGSDQEAR